MPLPDVHVRIFDAEEGTREMPAGEVGEICILGAAADDGLLEPPGRNGRRASRPLDGDDGGTRRWLHTGDLGYLDEDGYVFIVDRKKDLIKTSGYQVWPREIEEALATHPAVAEVGVAGVPDASRARPCTPGWCCAQGEAATEAELRAFCREQLAPYKVPVARRVPDGAAEDNGRQGAAAGAQGSGVRSRGQGLI